MRPISDSVSDIMDEFNWREMTRGRESKTVTIHNLLALCQKDSKQNNSQSK